jgi:hypothetical protein
VILNGMIRRIQTDVREARAEIVADARARAESSVPEGFEVTEARVSMDRRSTELTVSLSLRGGTTEPISGSGASYAEARADLHSRVPEGWQLLWSSAAE